jgi:hypothetical protein
MTTFLLLLYISSSPWQRDQCCQSKRSHTHSIRFPIFKSETYTTQWRHRQNRWLEDFHNFGRDCCCWGHCWAWRNQVVIFSYLKDKNSMLTFKKNAWLFFRELHVRRPRHGRIILYYEIFFDHSFSGILLKMNGVFSCECLWNFFAEGIGAAGSYLTLKLSEGEGRITIFAAQSTSRTFNYQVR